MTRETTQQMLVRVWRAVSTDLGDMEEHVYGSPDIARVSGLNVPSAGRAQRFFRGLGLIGYRSEYLGMKGGGQVVHTKALMSVGDGVTRIYKHFDAGRAYHWFESGEPGGNPPRAYAKKEAIVIADERSTEEVRAIVGPEPEKPMAALAPMRKDEPEALVEAARQYANRTTAVQEHVEALRGLGVEVDVLKVLEGISWKEDPILEAVASVLPIIDRWERRATVARAEAAALKDELTDLRKVVEPLRTEVHTLKTANRRLSEKNVAIGMLKTSQTSSQV